MNSLLDGIPVERRETVQAALAAAFGWSAVDVVQPISGGASGALTYRVEAAGKSYLLRIETRRGPLRNPHQYDCMRIASEAGIAPALRHVDADAGVAIVDFVHQRPIGEYVSSHNDPNPQNVLFDGGRLWLVDWETAYRNDPLTDVAILVECSARTPELESALVTAWLGSEPDRMLRARLALMRQLARLYYAGLLLSIAASQPRETPESDLRPPSTAEFRAALARGEHAPTSRATMFVLGKMSLAAFLAEMSAPGFDEALAIAREEAR